MLRSRTLSIPATSAEAMLTYPRCTVLCCAVLGVIDGGYGDEGADCGTAAVVAAGDGTGAVVP